MGTKMIDEALADDEISPMAKRYLRAGRARETGNRCTCELRWAQWCPCSGLCLSCGGLSWHRKWWTTPEEGE